MKLRELFEAIPSRHAAFYQTAKRKWDPEKYAKLFASYRGQFNVPGNDAFRIYIPLGKNIELGDIKETLSGYLENNGYEVVDFNEGIVKNKKDQIVKLASALNTLATDVAKAYKGDYHTYRINLSRKSKNDMMAGYTVVISRHPRDVVSMSIDRAWSGTSCMNPELYGGEYAEDYLPYDVSKGSLVAYLIRSGDEKKLKNPLLRVTIRPYYHRHGESKKTDDIILGVATKCYQALDATGKPTDSEANALVGPFLNTVREWVTDVHDSQNLIGEFELASELYSSESDERIKVISGKHQELIKNIMATRKEKGEEEFLDQFEQADYLIQQEIVRILPRYLDYLSMDPGSNFLLSLLDDNPKNILHIINSNIPIRNAFVDDAMENPNTFNILKKYYIDDHNPIHNFYVRLSMIEYDNDADGIVVQTMAQRGDIDPGMIQAIVKFDPSNVGRMIKHGVHIPANTVRTWLSTSALSSNTINNVLTHGNYTDDEIKDLLSTIVRHKKYDYLRQYGDIPLSLQQAIIRDQLTNINYLKNPDDSILSYVLRTIRPSLVLGVNIPPNKTDVAIEAFKQRDDLLAIADKFDGMSDPHYKKIVSTLRQYAMKQR
jgi:hypothetical protein